MNSRVADQPEVVCLCGSTRFKDEFMAEDERLERAGKIALSVGFFAHADDHDLDDEEKEMLDRLHKRKIDMADRVHVVNPGGYIGDSTRSEIEYAREHGVEVSYYEEPEDAPTHEEPDQVIGRGGLFVVYLLSDGGVETHGGPYGPAKAYSVRDSFKSHIESGECTSWDIPDDAEHVVAVTGDRLFDLQMATEPVPDGEL